jgi:hypothetical protein
MGCGGKILPKTKKPTSKKVGSHCVSDRHFGSPSTRDGQAALCHPVPRISPFRWPMNLSLLNQIIALHAGQLNNTTPHFIPGNREI